MIDFSQMEQRGGVQIDLSKKSKSVTVNLKKSNGMPIKHLYFGASWDPTEVGDPIDVDTIALGLQADNKAHDANDICFYNILETTYMTHSPDDMIGSSGSGDEDDEYLTVDFTKVPDNITEIALCVTIHKAKERKQTFGLVRSCVHINDADTGKCIATIDLSSDYSTDTAVNLGGFKRLSGNTWQFMTIGQGGLYSLADLLQTFGVNGTY